MNISWANKSLNLENLIIINGMKFKRRGEVQYYYSYYKTSYSIGHSYDLNC